MFQDQATWNGINEELTLLLRAAAEQAYVENLIDKDTRHKYYLSGNDKLTSQYPHVLLF